MWTTDADRARKMARALDYGTVYMNRCDSVDPALPWTGVKDSGRGSSLSALGFDALTRPEVDSFSSPLLRRVPSRAAMSVSHAVLPS